MKKIIIVGDNEFAEIASVYFAKDYSCETVAFAVEKNYISRDKILGIPVVAYEDLLALYNPKEYAFFAAPVYTQLNRLRQRFYEQCKGWGYEPLSYISPHAFVWENVEIGENTFIFEDNIVQYNARIGNNVILWSGNHIGHSAVVDEVKAELTPEFLATYPEPERFLGLLAEYLGVERANLCVTNGSDMAIRYIFEVFGRPGSSVLTVSPSFEMYRINCLIFGLTHKPVVYNADFTLDFDVYVCICVYVFVYVCTYMPVCVCVCVDVYICMCVRDM